MIEKWKKSLNEDGAFGVLQTDLLKTFDCLPHKLVIDKIHAYGVNITSPKLLYSCLIKWKQRIKLNPTCSSWSEINFGILQGSTLRPLLVNIFLYEWFKFLPDLDITNYADDNTPHSTNKNLNKILHDPEKEPNILFKWFTENLSETNPEKKTSSYKLNKKNSSGHFKFNGMAISNSRCKKFLGNHIDNKLIFESHVRYFCKKAS